MAESLLDPNLLFDLIARHVPADLKPNILVVGSLAAAYHHRDKLRLQGVNTKDADVVIQPAGAIQECKTIATRLLGEGWTRTEVCVPKATPDADRLEAIRLYPPGSRAYFIELLGFPAVGQTEIKNWAPVELADGWYGLPSFRYLGLTAIGRETAANGVMYATPSMMALSNLLSHPEIGTARMEGLVGGRKLLRSAKDLGRVLALARLAERVETETWAARWDAALQATFPDEFTTLAMRAGDGLRELLEDPSAMDEARHAVDVGLLAQYQVTVEQMAALADQLLVDALDPLARRYKTT